MCGLRLLTSHICCRSATRELQTQSPFFIGTQEICAPKLVSAMRAARSSRESTSSSKGNPAAPQT
jgi:hypothetical protein